MLIRNKSADAREIAVGDFSAYVEPGGTVDVPDDVANGTPPTGKEGDLDYYPGTSGLLAQTAVWEKAGPGQSADHKPSKADKSEEKV